VKVRVAQGFQYDYGLQPIRILGIFQPINTSGQEEVSTEDREAEKKRLEALKDLMASLGRPRTDRFAIGFEFQPIDCIMCDQTHTDKADPGAQIFDWEVWVTPYGRYLHMPGDIDIKPMLNLEIWSECGDPDPDYNHDDKSSQFHSERFYMFEMANGKKIVEAFERRGMFVRLQEVSKPRFGETFWMDTNGITAVK
jgi:hypothetical protein